MSRLTSLHRGVAAIATLLVLSACSGDESAQGSNVAEPVASIEGGTDAASNNSSSEGSINSSNDQELATPSDAQVADPLTASVYPNLFLTHGNGTQAWLQNIEVTAEGTQVTVQIANGLNFGLTIRDDMTLVASDGNTFTLEPDANLEIAEAAVAVYTFDFPALDTSVDAVTFVFNDGSNDSFDDEDAQGPSFVFDDVSLTSTGSPLATPANIGLADSRTHVSGLAVEVNGIAFTDERIGVAVTARNGNDRSRRELGGSGDATFVVDDLGNVYPLSDSLDNDFLRLDPASSLDGVLSFVGRVHPDAQALTLHINSQTTADNDTEFTSEPKFVMGPYSIDGSTEQLGLPQPIRVTETQLHANGITEFTVEALTFEDQQTRASVIVETQDVETTGLNSGDGTYLIDDLGNRYRLIPEPGNDRVDVSANSTLTADFLFAGRIAPQASNVTLFVNDEVNDGFDARMRVFPSFVFGPFTVTAGAAQSIDAPTAGVPLNSQASAAELEVSVADEGGLGLRRVQRRRGARWRSIDPSRGDLVCVW